jgi:hypothetical protein
MAIDPRILEQALMMEQQGAQPDGTGGITDMLTPQFDPTQYAEAGALPNLNLDLSNILTSSGVQDLSFDPAQYLNDSLNMDPQVKQDVEEEVSAVLENAEAGDEEDGIRAVAAVALDSSGISPEEVREGYTSISDLISEGGLPAVEQFVRDVYTDGNNMESIPEWALPASVFGTFLMNEPGDWRQAILRARGKTAATMLQKRHADAASKQALELEIRKKALELFAEGTPTAANLVGLVGKVTPESLAEYEKSNRLSDLVPITEQEDVAELLENFTAASVAAFQKSGNYNDLVRLPGKVEGGTTTLDFLKEFTPASVKLYEDGDRKDASVLVRKPNTTAGSTMSVDKMFELLETYTEDSVDAFKASGNFKDLIPKDPYGMNYPDVGETVAINQQELTKMTTDKFVNGLKDRNDEVKRAQLRKYRMLYMATIDTAREKISGEVMAERLPFGEYTPSQFAMKIGLDLDDPDIRRIVTIPEVKLPKAKPEDLTNLNSLYRLDEKWDTIGKIIEMAPENVTGVRGEWWNSTPAKILADVIPGMEIPAEATMTQVFNNVAEVNLIKEILKESRFSDKDRELVRQFITGTKFKNKREMMLRWNEVKEKITDGINLGEFTIEGRRVPEDFTPDNEYQMPGERNSELIQSILELSNNQTPD